MWLDLMARACRAHCFCLVARVPRVSSAVRSAQEYLESSNTLLSIRGAGQTALEGAKARGEFRFDVPAVSR
jgi:hypothetical protein